MPRPPRPTGPVTFAAVGDIHGQFRDAAAAVAAACAAAGVDPQHLSAIFAVGDVEPLHDTTQMTQVHGPAKHRKLGDFPDVVAGDITFTAPFFFIGGNHEPYEALDAHGGLVAGAGPWAPGVHYLGRAGVLNVAGLRVAFLSGIHSPAVSPGPARDRARPKDPNTDRKRRSYWAVDELARAAKAGRGGRVDLLLTHDWPTDLGTDARGNPTGCPHVRDLVRTVRPTLSCHGHMHHRQAGRLGATTVQALAHIRDGVDAVAVFTRDVDGTITALPTMGG